MDKETLIKLVKKAQKERLEIYRLSNQLYSTLKQLEVYLYELEK